jgi:hypothetical protein
MDLLKQGWPELPDLEPDPNANEGASATHALEEPQKKINDKKKARKSRPGARQVDPPPPRSPPPPHPPPPLAPHGTETVANEDLVEAVTKVIEIQEGGHREVQEQLKTHKEAVERINNIFMSGMEGFMNGIDALGTQFNALDTKMDIVAAAAAPPQAGPSSALNTPAGKALIDLVGHLLMDSHNNQALGKTQILSHLASALSRTIPCHKRSPS